MRAPPLARMAAVAAPRPDAEPVTIAHKPSFDIRFSSSCFETLFERPIALRLAYRAAKSLQIRNSVARNLFFARYFMPPLQVALRTALVRAMAFPHHKAQEKTAPQDLALGPA